MAAEQAILDKVLGSLEDEIEDYLAKYGEKHHATKWLIEYRSRIEALGGRFPSDAEQLKGVDVKYKARIIKAELRSVFPDQTFSVTINRYSGGSSIHVEWGSPPMLAEDEAEYHGIIGKYSYEYPDSNPQADYCHVDNFAFGQGPGYKPPQKKVKKSRPIMALMALTTLPLP